MVWYGARNPYIAVEWGNLCDQLWPFSLNERQDAPQAAMMRDKKKKDPIAKR